MNEDDNSNTDSYIYNFDENLLSMNSESPQLTRIVDFFNSNYDKIEFYFNYKYKFLDKYCSTKILERSKNLNLKKLRDEARDVFNNKIKEGAKISEDFNIYPNRSLFNQIIIGNPNKLNGYNIFVRDIFSKETIVQNNKTIKEVAQIWNELDINLKNSYKEYAKIIIDERIKIKNAIEILNKENFNNYLNLVHGPFKFYIKELGDNVEILNAKEKWENLSDVEKENYVELYYQDRHNYVVKKLEYTLSLKKTNRYLTAFNLFTNDISKEYTQQQFRFQEFFDFVYEKWTNLDQDNINKYEKISETLKNELIEKYSKRLVKQRKDNFIHRDKYGDNLSTELSRDEDTNDETFVNKKKKYQLDFINLKRGKYTK